MSDQRTRIVTKIVDPTTDANEAGVDAAGNLQVICGANSGVDIGDVDVTTMPGTAAEAAALPAVFVVVAGDDGTDTHPLQVDASGFLKAILQSNTGVDIGDVDVTSMPATAAEDAALPAVVMVVGGDDGTDTRILQLDASGNLKTILAANTGVDIGDVDVTSLPNTESDDDIVAGAQDAMRVIALTYGWDGTQWERIQTDAAGAMDVNFTGAPNEDTDDDSVAGGATAQRVIGLTYAYDGTNWERLQSDTNGALKTILQANSGVDIGDVDVTSMPGTAAEAAALPAVFVVVAGDDGTDTHPLQTDAAGALKVILQANTGVDIGDVDILSGPTGASALEVQGTAADGAAAVGDPVQIGGVDGSGNMQRVLTDTDGHVQVDVLSGGGTDAPTNPTIDTDNTTNTAAGSPADLDSAEITEAEKLWEVHVSASVAFKAQIKVVEDGTPRNVSALMFGRAGETLIWTTPHRDFVAHAGAAAGLDVFRATVTNMDNSVAADLHACFYYST
jgi:hypothetical protein